MDVNQIIMIFIVILIAIIFLLVLYFVYTNIRIKKGKKIENNIFNPEKIVEEKSLLNILDDKVNLEINENKLNVNSNNYISSNNDKPTEKLITQQDRSNPFGVDMTRRTKENIVVNDEKNNENKFFKN